MARCLIVDDSSFMRRIIRETIEEGGHDVAAETDNGIDALALYAEMEPDLVTMDITMYGKDGIVAIADITRDYPDARIVVVSALSEKTLHLYTEKINAKAFITKPFDKKDFLEVINRALTE